MGSAASTLSESDLTREIASLQKELPDRFNFLLQAMLKAKAEAASQSSLSAAVHMNVSSKDGTLYFDPSMGTFSVSNEIAAEISLLRSNPQGYCQYLEAHIDRFVTDDAYVLKDSPNVRYMTEEGKKAVLECIDDLRNTQPMSPMEPNALLEKAAFDHVNDLASHPGLSGHEGSDGSQARDRIERYGKFEYTCGENIDYGMNTCRDIIVHLLIDDGVPGRGHRKNLLETKFLAVGASFGSHHEYRCCCVMDFAGGMKDFDDMPSEDSIIDCPAGQDLPLSAIKIIKSFTSGEQSTELIAQLMERLGTGSALKINYMHAKKTCEIVIGGVEINTYSWE